MMPSISAPPFRSTSRESITKVGLVGGSMAIEAATCLILEPHPLCCAPAGGDTTRTSAAAARWSGCPLPAAAPTSVSSWPRNASTLAWVTAGPSKVSQTTNSGAIAADRRDWLVAAGSLPPTHPPEVGRGVGSGCPCPSGPVVPAQYGHHGEAALFDTGKHT